MAFHNIAPPGITASVAPTNRDKNHTLLAPVHPNSSGIDARRASSLTYSSECSILSGVVGFVNGIAPMGGVACDADGGPDCVAVGGYGMGSAGQQRPGGFGPGGAKGPGRNREIGAAGATGGQQKRGGAAPPAPPGAGLVK